MPLTPEDVSNKRFTPVRLREGYDMGEVDQFLDEVQTELSRLTRENEDLRSQLSAASQGGAVATPAPAAEASLQEVPGEAAAEPEPEVIPEPAPVETIKVTTAAEASSAATRLLELATRSADELVGEATQQAEQILSQARARSEQLEADSARKADQVESDARTRAQMLDSETAERRDQLLGDLEKDKEKLNGDVEDLRSFEREYRARLKTYFEQQLSALEGSDEDGVAQQEGGPKRLRSLLGDDADTTEPHHR